MASTTEFNLWDNRAYKIKSYRDSSSSLGSLILYIFAMISGTLLGSKFKGLSGWQASVFFTFFNIRYGSICCCILLWDLHVYSSWARFRAQILIYLKVVGTSLAPLAGWYWKFSGRYSTAVSVQYCSGILAVGRKKVMDWNCSSILRQLENPKYVPITLHFFHIMKYYPTA